MKNIYILVLILYFVVFSSFASADTMRCGEGLHVIDDGDHVGKSRAQIIELCGQPESSSDGNLYYKIGGVTYKLRFNDSDELKSISEVDE